MIDKERIVDGKVYGLLYIQPIDKRYPERKPAPDLSEYGRTEIVEYPDKYAVYFRSYYADHFEKP